MQITAHENPDNVPTDIYLLDGVMFAEKQWISQQYSLLEQIEEDNDSLEIEIEEARRVIKWIAGIAASSHCEGNKLILDIIKNNYPHLAWW